MKINKIILTTENPKHADGSLFSICLGGYKTAKPAKDSAFLGSPLFRERGVILPSSFACPVG